MKNKKLIIFLIICALTLSVSSSVLASEYFGGSVSFFNRDSYPGVTSSVVWEFTNNGRWSLSNAASLILGINYGALAVKSDLKYAVFQIYPWNSIVNQIDIGVLLNLELKNIFGEPYIRKMSQRGLFANIKFNPSLKVYGEWIPRTADSLLPLFGTKFIPEVVVGAEYTHLKSETSVRGEFKLSADTQRSYIKMGVGRKF